MSANSSSKTVSSTTRRTQIRLAIGYVLWVAFAFILAQFLTVGLFKLVSFIGVPVRQVSPIVLQTSLDVVAYMLAVLIAIGLPWRLRKQKTKLVDIGLQNLPSWADLGLGPVAFIPYIALSAFFAFAAKSFIPGFEVGQAQNVGFEHISLRYEYLLAFLTLVVLAPLVEEILFRGYLYGKLRKSSGIIMSVLLTSLCFAVLHLQLNVGLDVFALSLVLCTLRELTGSIWAGVLLHMLKNCIAFYVLFILPMIQ